MSPFLFLLELNPVIHEKLAAEDKEQDDSRDDLGREFFVNYRIQFKKKEEGGHTK